MSFKIETKEQFTTILVESDTLNLLISEKLTAQIHDLLQKGSQNFIIDISKCTKTEVDFLDPTILLASSCYEQECSFVISGANTAFIQLIKAADAIDLINYAPSLQEAIDIVSMEILERDLLNE